MENTIRGVSIRSIPFISSILAPQLKLRHLPLYFVDNISEIPTIAARFSLLDGDVIRKQSLPVKQELTTYLKNLQTSIALMSERSHIAKLELLELGFHYCIDIPTSTEIIIKTLENNVTNRPKSSNRKLENSPFEYQTNGTFSYLHDSAGRQFLVNRTKSIYLNQNEHRILEYLIRRKGFASIKELAYAGWKQFDIRPNTITVTIKKLRLKLHKISLPYNIRSLYGYGYTIDELS